MDTSRRSSILASIRTSDLSVQPPASDTPFYHAFDQLSSLSREPSSSTANYRRFHSNRFAAKISLSLPRLKRRRLSALTKRVPGSLRMSFCTLGGYLDCPKDTRDVLSAMLSDPQLHSLCDVVLVVQDERFMAHRAVLAAASCVFKAMFTNCMKERDAHEIVLSCVSKHAWRMVMQYIYNAQVNLDNNDDALVLLSTARMYQLERLESFVEMFLVQRVQVTNALLLMEAAERYDLQRLRDACFAVMEQNFEAMMLSPAFICCPIHVVSQLLSSSALIIKSETVVFDAAIRWICGGNQTERKEHLDMLMSIVRLERMTEAEVKTAARHEMVQNNAHFRDRVFERLVMSSADPSIDQVLNGRSHLKCRRRDAVVFTFAHKQKPIGNIPQADTEEIVRTPWKMDHTGKRLWRLKIYPQGYNKAKGHYLSMYVQGCGVNASDHLDVSAKFDIFLINQREEGMTVSFSSVHHFRDANDHWGFHRFLQLSQLMDVNAGFRDADTDSVIVGANLYF